MLQEWSHWTQEARRPYKTCLFLPSLTLIPDQFALPSQLTNNPEFLQDARKTTMPGKPKINRFQREGGCTWMDLPFGCSANISLVLLPWIHSSSVHGEPFCRSVGKVVHPTRFTCHHLECHYNPQIPQWYSTLQGATATEGCPHPRNPLDPHKAV